jgi:hypothetical protein
MFKNWLRKIKAARECKKKNNTGNNSFPRAFSFGVGIETRNPARFNQLRNRIGIALFADKIQGPLCQPVFRCVLQGFKIVFNSLMRFAAAQKKRSLGYQKIGVAQFDLARPLKIGGCAADITGIQAGKPKIQVKRE